MCWNLRVYAIVLHNLFVRFFTDLIYDNCCCCQCCCDCSKHKKTKQVNEPLNSSPSASTYRSSANIQHDYVIVDEIDANYLQIERRHVEVESFYRTIDRSTAEEMLSCREDGACLVRPYKETDITIKYIVSIYAHHQYFHLFIRQIDGKELYAIGQEKSNEKLFNSPCEIIDFYSYNTLQCSNKNTTLSLVLKPIIA